MKLRTLVAAAALVLIPVATVAATPGLDGAEHNRVDRLAEVLDLDGEQKDAIGSILDASEVEGIAIRERLDGLLGELREARDAGDEREMKRLLKEVDNLKEDAHTLQLSSGEQIRGELTLTQEVRFVEMNFERHERMKRLHEGMRRRSAEGGRL